MRRDRLAHGRDVEVELVAGPARLHLRAAGNMLLQLVDVVGDAAPRLVLAELVRQVDFDGLCHRCDVARAFSAFQAALGDYHSADARARLAVFRRGAACRSAAMRSPVPPPAPAAGSGVEPGRAVHHAPARTSPDIAAGISPRRGARRRSRRSTTISASAQVGGIVPTWQLFRTATSWQRLRRRSRSKCRRPSEWPHIVQTLRYVRDYVIPAVGPVEAGLGLSQPDAQRCAGGAPESAHKLYSAIDMVPLRPITREKLMRTLCGDPFAARRSL